MDQLKPIFYVRIPMPGYTPEQLALGTGYCTIARAITPEGAADVVRAVCANPLLESDHVRVEIRREL